MRMVVIFLAVTISVFVLACAGAGDQVNGDTADGSFSTANSALNAIEGAAAAPAPAAAAATVAPAATAAPSVAFARSPIDDGEERGSQAGALETSQRKIISTASVSLEVEVVPEVVDQVRAIAEGLGGFVEQLSSSGGSDEQRANITVRVPQAQFFTAMESIEALGEVQSRNLGTEDVSEQFIDLEARLKSSLREESSLLSLLERAGVVSEVIAIERELSRIRSDIERFQGQLNFLERRVDLATINVSLRSPQVETGEPPSGSVTLRVTDIGATVESVKGLVGSLKGVIDQVFISQRYGREEARMSFRVFGSEFTQAMDFLEGQGEVRRKEVSEGTVPTGDMQRTPKNPDAIISLSLVVDEDSSNTTLIVAIAAPIGGVALLSVLGLLFYLSYRAGRRQGTQV